MWSPTFIIYFIILIALTIIMVLVGRILSSPDPYLGKLAPYECGFDPIKSPRLPFSFRFFLVAILFLIFDLEIALLLVLPFSISLVYSSTATWIVISFIVILVAGLYYEWVKGGLEWAES